MTIENNVLPEIEINNDKLYTALKIGFMVAAFTVITFNVLAAHATIMNGTEGAEGVACPPNTMPPDGHCGEIIITQNATLIILEQNGSSGYPPEEGTGYPDNYYNDTNGIPNELIDDDLEEEDEEQDEKLHEEESKQK